MADLGSIGAGATLGATGGAVTSSPSTIPHLSTEALVASDGFSQAPVTQAQVIGALDVTETITAEVG